MKFRRKNREDKLYEQWVEHGDLPAETSPQREGPEEGPVSKGENKRVSPVVYISIGAGILVWGICLVLLFMESC